jgi:protein TonB
MDRLSARPRRVAFAGSLALHAALIAVVGLAALAPVREEKPIRITILEPEGGGSGGPKVVVPAEIQGPVYVPPPPKPAVAQPKPKPKPVVKARPVEKRRPAQVASVSKPAAPATGGAPSTTGGNGGGSGGGSGGGVGRATGSGRGSGAQSALAAYLSSVRGRLEAVKRYPALAKRRGTEGTAKVAIVIDAAGRPGGVRIAASSGSIMLDEEVERMVARAAPFPPLPAELGEPSVRLVVPISFTIDDRADAR